MSRFMGDWLVAFIECRGCQFAAGPLLQAPLGLVDNAWDLESEDCGLESRMGVHWRSDAPNLGRGLVFVASPNQFDSTFQIRFSSKTK